MDNPIGFSTLACPDWSLVEALHSGREYGFDCVEVRLVDGAPVTPATSADARRAVAGQLADSGLPVTTLATSVKLTDGDAAVAELRALIEIAVEWSASRLRVFGGRAEPNLHDAIARMAGVLHEVVSVAREDGVGIAIETHDDLSSAAAVGALLRSVPDPAFGVIWDVGHTWRVGDSPADVVAELGERIVEVQVKDFRRGDDGAVEPVLLDHGDVPWRGSLTAAVEAGFVGPIVVEWEKYWYPGIAEPEVALPQHLAAIRSQLREAG